METCAAIATAPYKSGISVIRLSGDDCFEIAQKVFFPASKRKLVDLPANLAVYGSIVGADGIKIDTGMCTCFHAPKSYTGENSVEISCHGSPVGTSLVLSALLQAGARQALPGEFTKRAFINGKLDLTQAQAVEALIEAKSTASLKLSLCQLDGIMGKKIKEISDELTLLLASVYAYIDYPDEDMTDISDSEMKQRLLKVKSQLDYLSSTYDTGVAINDGVPTAIVGSPNTGKSSLLNLLSGFDRAIVTDIAGTTRDIVTQTVSVGDILLKLSDTAGIRNTEDVVEKIGVDKALEELEKSQIILALFDVSQSISQKDKDFCEKLKSLDGQKKIVIILNKCDIASAQSFEEYIKQQGFVHIVKMSAKTGEGRNDFEREIVSLYPDVSKASEGLIITNARLFAALNGASCDVSRALEALDMLTPDTACLDIEGALSKLLEADGRQVSEEIVNSIFSHFCVGK